MMPGKKDFVRNGRLKVQRRVLLDSLINLFKRFKKETNVNISYTTFVRSRPFWVTFPKARDRETCGCVVHENLQFLVSSLKRANLVDHDDLTEHVKSTVCSTKEERCMTGMCSKCKNKTIPFKSLNDCTVKYFQWENAVETRTIKGENKKIKRTVKAVKEERLSKLRVILEKKMVHFKKHVFAMKHQARHLRQTKETLGPHQLIFQVDFSQNYVGKCTSEIQSMHFGASKKQISLHTGAMYFNDGNSTQCKTFCTVSDNLDHQAHGVWGHLTPILKDAAEEFPNTKKVHFFSDSPTSQYRNRFNIFFMNKFLPQFFKKIEHFTWNFSEPGHGKGVMDGVGGSLKRTADQHVLHGKDITCAHELSDIFKNSKTKVIEVSSSSIVEMKKSIPAEVEAVSGITKIRQVSYNSSETSMSGRRLSCSCNKSCKHYHVTDIFPIECAPTEKTTTSKQGAKKVKKLVLKVSDVYTTDEEDDECVQDTQEADSFIKPKPYDFNDLKMGTYVVVSFPVGKKSFKHFVGVIQGEIQPDREVEVMFMESSSSNNALFRTNEEDISFISCDQIVGILPNPVLVSKGNRLFFDFEKQILLL